MEKLNKLLYVGVALIAMATLMLELVLIRIFSVTLWYHFAFMAISIALLGMGVSGIYVYLFAPVRSPENTMKRLAVGASAFAVTAVIALIVQLNIRFVPSFSPKSFLQLSQVYLVVAVPFFFGGYCISLVLTQFSRHVSKLYFSDLVGAGIGCFLVFPVLTWFSGPSAVIVAASIAALSALVFAVAARWKALLTGSSVLLIALVSLLAINETNNVFKITFAKGVEEENVLLERWNPLSRVILSSLGGEEEFSGWSPSMTFTGKPPHAMMLTIDAHAATPIYKFDGDFSKIEALKIDSTSAAYHLKNSGKALVIGPGGGKDILTALLFGIDKAYGVELNPSVVEIVKEDHREYSGNLYHRDDVHVVVDEGRSYIARSKEKFDIIQASLVDSWAATAAGAFVLTENNLYTRQAFEQYYRHLTDDGILTMSRVFTPRCGQTLRLIALGYEAWKSCGISNPANHIMAIKNGYIGTVLFKKSPFTMGEVKIIQDLCARLKFEFVASPLGTNHPVLAGLYSSGGSPAFYRTAPYNLEAPVDDKPFFFHMLRLKDLLRSQVRDQSKEIDATNLFTGFGGLAGLSYNDNAVFVLGSLIVIVTILCLGLILGPLWTFRRDALRESKGKWALLGYFTCLGVGFMMVEIPLMHKLMLFLGHPIYAFSVTLFGLLVFSGLGSLLTEYLAREKSNRFLGRMLLLTVLIVGIYILAIPPTIHALIAVPTALKIPLVILAMLPLGLLLGMPFPLGIKLVDRKAPAMIPWVWGVNGATSVFASVFSIAVAITWGYSSAMIIGLCAYLAAFGVIHLKSLQ